MTTYFSEFMKTQIAGGYTFASKQMGLVLLYRSAAVTATTPTSLVGLLAAPGFQEVSGPPDLVTCPTYRRHEQNVNQTVPTPAQPAPQTQAVIYGADWDPIPATTGAQEVFVAAGLWYIAGATPVGGVTNPWVMISDDMFGNIVAPGVRLSGTPRELFRFVVRGADVDMTRSVLLQSPGILDWESARIQHVHLIPQRVNWIPNPSGENTSLFGWRAKGTLSRVQGGVDRQANYFLRATGNQMESIAVPSQAQWRMSCYARSTTATKFNMGLISLDESYAPVSTQMAKVVGKEWPLRTTWTRFDAIIRAMDDVVAVIPHFEVDAGPFDLDLCMLENSHALNAYWDGGSLTGASGDFTWQGQPHQSYGMYYCNRLITAARLFGQYKEGQVTLEALAADWVPTGTTVFTHWNVLSQFDTKHPLEDWGSRVIP